MSADPFELGRDVLDDTPWYIPGADNRRGTERSLGFCNWAGFEDDRMVVMGGLRNPGAEPYAWQCRNYAHGRYWMACTEGHRNATTLCHGHVWMIQHHHSRARNMVCPRCVSAGGARELEEKINGLMRQLANPNAWPDERKRWADQMRWAQEEMTERFHRGLIKTGGPLRLEEMS